MLTRKFPVCTRNMSLFSPCPFTISVETNPITSDIRFFLQAVHFGPGIVSFNAVEMIICDNLTNQWPCCLSSASVCVCREDQ